MRLGSIPTTLFKKNRQKLIGLLPTGSFAVINSSDRMPRNGDQMFPFRQNSDLLYLTGINQEETVLVLFPADGMTKKETEVLYILKPNEELETWEGKKLSEDDARRISGIQTVKYSSDFEMDMALYALKYNTIFLCRNENPRYKSDVETRDDRFICQTKKKFPLHKLERLAPLIGQLRMKKEPEELELISRACRMTGDAFGEILSVINPGMMEYEIESVITRSFLSAGANGHAFEPIVASGGNACFLHYNTNNCPMQDGDMVLIDFGAEYGNYASDCTRTIPVGGTFSPRQKAVHDACHRVFSHVKAIAKPGYTINELHKASCLKMEQELMGLGLLTQDEINKQNAEKPLRSKYFMHGVSHFMGLDTHDVGSKDDVLEAGMIITCEPGIYIKNEGLGVRIETDLLITHEGNRDLMDFIPSSASDIEFFYSESRKR